MKLNTDLLICQTKTGPQETLTFKVTKSIDTFSKNTPLEPEDGRWMLGVTSLEVYTPAFNVTKHDDKCAI